MKAVRRLLEWERNAIVDAYREGEKVASISSEFGVSEDYPTILARRRGVAARPWGRPRKNLQFQKPVLVQT